MANRQTDTFVVTLVWEIMVPDLTPEMRLQRRLREEAEAAAEAAAVSDDGEEGVSGTGGPPAPSRVGITAAEAAAACYVCKVKEEFDADVTLLCDGCDGGACHVQCARLAELPPKREQWFCHACRGVAPPAPLPEAQRRAHCGAAARVAEGGGSCCATAEAGGGARRSGRGLRLRRCSRRLRLLGHADRLVLLLRCSVRSSDALRGSSSSGGGGAAL
jgi:hypothetical protein